MNFKETVNHKIGDIDISIIIPVLNEEKNIEELYSKITEVMTEIKLNYELIFIDDGSTDNTFRIARELLDRDKHIKLIKFKKNFGKSSALSAGFRYSKGKIIITMDGDLQDDPTEIPNFIQKIREGYDLVSGWKFQRRDPITKTVPSKIFNKLTAVTTGVKIHDFNCGFKAYQREVVKNIDVYGELHRYIPVLAQWRGYSVGEIKVKHHPRKYGKSKYGPSRILLGFLDLITVKFITMHSKKPFHLFGPIGLSLFTLGCLVLMYLLTLHFLFLLTGAVTWELRSRPLLLLSMLFIILGIQLISLGLFGEQIASSGEKVEYTIEEIL